MNEIKKPTKKNYVTYNQRMAIKKDIAREVAIGDIYLKMKKGKISDEIIFLQVISKQVTKVEVKRLNTKVVNDKLTPIINSFCDDKVVGLNIAYLIDNRIYLTRKSYKYAVNWEDNREFYKSQI